jgi:hypothetical protein
MVKSVEVAVRVSDLREFGDVIQCAADVIRAYDVTNSELVDTGLVEAIENLRLALAALAAT